VKALYVFCEGRTEQGFCNQVLRPHLFPEHNGMLHTILIAHSKHHGLVRRGGIGKYAALERDILYTLKSRDERDVFFTTMIDLYKLPRDFPGKVDLVPDPNNPTPHVQSLEKAFGEAIGDSRFIPYIQLYEYETLLFSDPEGFRVVFEDCEAAIDSMKNIAASFPSTEHINDGEATAPSKRIIDSLPEYGGLKTTAGPDVAEFIGLPTLRKKCSHFDVWLTQLERL
jgi:hypothetical protein